MATVPFVWAGTSDRILKTHDSNIWDGADTDNENSVRLIGNHYKFSKRLTSLMVLKPRQDFSHSRVNEERISSGTTRGGDVEPGLNGGTPKSDTDEKSKLPLAGRNSLDLYLLVKNTVNYFDTDLTPKVCRWSMNSMSDMTMLKAASATYRGTLAT